ncbi:MAG: acyl carrier protein [Chroococcales cyanobacterium]
MNVRNLAVKEISATEIQDWIVTYVADLLEIEPEEVDVTIPFDRYGLDSSVAVGLTGDLEDWLGREIEPTLLYYYPTIEAVVQYLSSQLNGNS